MPSDFRLPYPRDWDLFERRMRDLFEAEWRSPAKRHGRPGQHRSQHGVDIYGKPEGQKGYHGVQCKLHDAIGGKTLTAEQLRDEVRKAEGFRPKLVHFILATTASTNSNVQEVERKLNLPGENTPPFSVEVMFWDDICSLYDDHPDVFAKHYPGWSPHRTDRLHQLPPPPRDFTGREAELARLRAAFGEGGATISVKAGDGDASGLGGVQGMGGVGKTALALQIALELAPRYPDAQFFLDLKGAHPDGKPLTTAEAMAHVIRSYRQDAVLPEDPKQLTDLYRSILHGKKALLLMDNAADAAQVGPLIPPPPCAMLVTSRQHFTLPGLAAVDLYVMEPADACKLLLKIAPRIAGHAQAVAELCGHLPLALRLAASALAEHKDISPEQYALRLTDARQRLKLVDASLSLSYGLLDADMRRRWAMLAVFPGTFDCPAAAAVWEVGADHAAGVLGELVRSSMVEWNESSKRYHLHDLARVYADSRLDATEREASKHRHASHYLAILGQADRLYMQGGESLARGLALFDLEWANIQAGQACAAGRADADKTAAHLCSDYPDAGIYCLCLRLHSRRQIDWLQAGLTAARTLKDRAAEGVHLGNLGLAYARLSETRRAIEFYEQHLSIAREIGDRRGEGQALGNLGLAYAALGETRRAIECHEQYLTIAREIGDRSGEGNALGNLGNAYAALGETRRAIEFYEQSLSIAQKIGDRRGEGQCLGNLGNAYAALDETCRTIEFYKQALSIAREIGDRRGEGNDLFNMSQAMYKLGDKDGAIACTRQALAIFEQIESPSADKARRQLAEWGAKP